MIARPNAPFVFGSDTSEAAAHRIGPHLERLEIMVLDAVLSEGGATCDLIEEVTGLSHQTASARIRALVKTGHLYNSGERRQTRSGRSAVVWRAVPVQTTLFS